MEHQLDVAEWLQPPPEARGRPAHALGDRADPPAIGGVQVQDPVGLRVADRAQHDRLGLVGSAHQPSLDLGQAGRAESMPQITMYTTNWCGYCVRAKALLDAKGLAYE